MNKYIKYTMALVVAASAASCDDYLSEIPNRGQDEVLNNVEQLHALFANSDLFSTPAGFVAPQSDDFFFTTDMADALGYVSSDFSSAFTWSLEGCDAMQYDDTWSSCYQKVFTANLVINGIDDVEASDEEKSEYLAHAHFLRGMAMLELANNFCLPYSEETLNELGLPLKQSTGYEESLARATVGETYKFIEDDLLAAYNGTPRADITEQERWLVGKTSAAALLARFYLFTGNYEKSEQFAKEALKSTVATLFDYNQFSTYTITAGGGWYAKHRSTRAGEDDGDEWGDDEWSDDEWNEDGDDWGDDDWGESGTELTFCELYGWEPADYSHFSEFFYPATYNINMSTSLLPSEALVNLYDHDNDLRFNLFYVENGYDNYYITGCGFGNEWTYHNISSWSGEVYFGAAPTVAEVYLTLAEAQARQGKTVEALANINTLRASRYAAGSDYELAESDGDVLTLVLDERHRELPFMMRWYDIRRFAYNETPSDDVVPVHNFYGVKNGILDYEPQTFTLPLKSRRYAKPILTKEIERSYGQIEQNKY